MKLLYCDATLGVSGDMFLGALVDLGVPLERISSAVSRLGVARVRLETEAARRKGLRAARVLVHVEEDHAHRRLADLRAILEGSSLDEWVRREALAVFELLATAEAAVHGRPVEEIHFHEVGALDAVVDVVGVAVGLRELACDLILSSPIAVGSGSVTCAHGLLPIPAPATAELLRGAMTTGGNLEGECSTPTGVALLRHFAPRQEGLPDMLLERVGIGAGERDPGAHPNCFRLFLGSAREREADSVLVLETNIDDMSPQSFGFLSDALFEAGALDVFLTSVQMKKGRPGVLVSVVADPPLRDAIETILFRETTTLGVRSRVENRAKLPRSVHAVRTPFGEIRVKVATLDGRVVTVSPEHDDVARAAREARVAFREVYDAARQAYREGTHGL